jgi:hypothetical protein
MYSGHGLMVPVATLAVVAAQKKPKKNVSMNLAVFQ